MVINTDAFGKIMSVNDIILYAPVRRDNAIHFYKVVGFDGDRVLAVPVNPEGYRNKNLTSKKILSLPSTKNAIIITNQYDQIVK